MSIDLELADRSDDADLSASVVGKSLIMKQLLSTVEKLAELNAATVLVHGAAGTGKTLLAKTLHRLAARSTRRSLTWIDSESSTERVVARELGEWVRATERAEPHADAWHIAPHRCATLILREVGLLSRVAQRELLAWLDRARSMGADAGVDRRLIVTTSRDLPSLVERGAFLSPLYARLAALQIRVPALCERHGDVMLIATYFLANIAGRLGTELEFDPDTSHRLGAYTFPGNVSELRRLVEDSAMAARGRVVSVGPLPFGPIALDRGLPQPFFAVALDDAGKPPSLKWVEHAYATRVLAFSRGNRAETARVLGVSYPTIIKKIRGASGGGRWR